LCRRQLDYTFSSDRREAEPSAGSLFCSINHRPNAPQ
jgi:hypothetical protein